MTATDAEILAAFDSQVRQSLVPPQAGWVTERAGTLVVRTTAAPDAVYGCYVEWSDLDEDTADAAIAEQLAHYGGLGRRFEWKTYGHDGPADLPDRLLAAGFVAEDEEALVIGPVEAVVAACRGTVPPPGSRSAPSPTATGTASRRCTPASGGSAATTGSRGSSARSARRPTASTCWWQTLAA